MSRFNIFHSQPLIHSVTTTKDGNTDSRYGSPQQIEINLASICSCLQLDPASIIQAEQTHQTDIARVDSSHQGKTIPTVDGLITQDPNITLMLRLADCVSVFLYDPQHQAIGLVHSGWRGSIGKIALQAVQQMMLHYSTQPQNLLVALGPSVQPQSNLWPDPPYQAELPEWQPFIKHQNNQYHIDLPGFIKQTLINCGVSTTNIELSPIDTVSDTNYYSHLRAKRTHETKGRFAALFKLQN